LALAKPFWLKPIFKINYYFPPFENGGNSIITKSFENGGNSIITNSSKKLEAI
jgi:hypothetical protein